MVGTFAKGKDGKLIEEKTHASTMARVLKKMERYQSKGFEQSRVGREAFNALDQSARTFLKLAIEAKYEGDATKLPEASKYVHQKSGEPSFALYMNAMWAKKKNQTTYRKKATDAAKLAAKNVSSDF